MLTLRVYFLPGLCHSGSSTSFLNRDVLANVKKLGIAYSVVSEQETCLMADGQACDIRETVSLSVKIRTFSWKFEFFIMEDCPVNSTLRVDFLFLLRLILILEI
jgi:hypothetical protein